MQKNKNYNLLVKLLIFFIFSVYISSINSVKRPTDNLTPPPTPELINSNNHENDGSTENNLTTAQATNSTTSGQSGSIDQDNISNEISTAKKLTEKSKYIQEYVLGDYIFNTAGNYFKEPVRTYSTMITPNDVGSGQWWETSLRLPEAWDISTGGSETVLAIIDTGVALNHEEFTDRWYSNLGEVGSTVFEGPSLLNCTDRSLTVDESCNLVDDDFDGILDNESGVTSYENPSRYNCTDQSVTLNKNCNMIDDDGNGLVDDWRGWDFINYDNSVQAGEINPNGSGTKHATYVTGVAAANANNNVGIAGVNWNTKLLPLQAIDDNGYGNSLSVARAIRYATDQGADVISLSLGGAFPDSFLRQSIREAIEAGIIVVAASGNDGCNCMSYPANYPEVVAVGAIDSTGLPAYFSSYGTNLDILAPGANIYTSSWSASNSTSAYSSNIAGTSLATPLISGALTTLRSLLPNASQTELLALLTENTDRMTLPSNQNRSNSFGYGTADIYKASQRSIVPFSSTQITSFSPVSYGGTLFPSSPPTINGKNSIYQCAVGTTPVYKLTFGSTVVYSSSLLETAQAQMQGYSTSLFTYLCSLQPHDTVSSVRLLNIAPEFENFFRK